MNNCTCKFMSIIMIMSLVLTMPSLAQAVELADSASSQLIQQANNAHTQESPADSQDGMDQEDDSQFAPYLIIENPTIVSDGSNLCQLSAEELSADTQVLLQTVLNSEYIRIARISARLFSSEATPLSVHYSAFNGYTELLSRNDFETTLLTYAANATETENGILQEMLQRSDMQEKLSELALARVTTLSGSCPQRTYAIGTDADWVGFDELYDIDLEFSQEISFYGGQTIKAYTATDSYSRAEIEEVDDAIDNLNLSVTLVEHAKASYNCHSYAWFSMDNFNPYWIGVGKNFDDDKADLGEIMFIPNTATYIASGFQLNDIVVYYNEFNEILHSAVIVEIDGDNIIVQSKWGQAGLYRHALGTVPSGYLRSDGQLQYKVYRYHYYARTITDLGHMPLSHKYQYTDICTVCGQTITQTVTVECSGPPCISPFSLRDFTNDEVE